MINRIIIGARGSKLSLAYAKKVKNLISSSLNKKCDFQTKIIKTSGDLFQNKKISEIGGKNIFCKEIEDNLKKKKIDIAVHSLKDMDSFEENDLVIGAYLKRNDPRDVIILKKGKTLKCKNLIIGSSSKRRELQFKLLLKNIKCKDIRGNVDTRLSKIANGNYDGTILALAGIQSLSLKNDIYKVFSTEEIIPAAGQGVIAVQCRKDNKKILNILKKVNDNETKICSLAERSLLKTIGGDCNTAIGVYAKVNKKNIILTSQLFSDDGKYYFSLEKVGDKKFPTRLGKLSGLELLKRSKGKYKKKR